LQFGTTFPREKIKILSGNLGRRYTNRHAKGLLWILGLIAFFADHRYRMLAWMYMVPVFLFLAGKGQFYYVADAYPPLLAMG